MVYKPKNRTDGRVNENGFFKYCVVVWRYMRHGLGGVDAMIYGNTLISNFKQCVDPFRSDQVQPASYDLRLGCEFNLLKSPRIEAAGSCEYENIRADHYELKPGAFILGTTIERVFLPITLAAHVDGRSSMGRIGLLVHCTAGWIDPGFHGQITLEIKNIGPATIILKSGTRIAQLVMHEVVGCDSGYTGKYQNQMGVQGAKSD